LKTQRSEVFPYSTLGTYDILIYIYGAAVTVYV